MTEYAFESHDAPTVIRTKRDGGTLSDAQIDWVIDGYTRGVVHDEQMSALLMAIFLKGMSTAEITRWTAAMVGSGVRFDFDDLRRPSGAPLALDPGRVLLALKTPRERADVEQFLHGMEMFLEDEPESSHIPGERVNHTKLRYWAQARR